MHMHTHAHTHTCMHTYTHTHTHTYAHTHTRTYARTHTPLVSRPVFIYRVDCNKSVFFLTNFYISLSHIIFMSVTYASLAEHELQCQEANQANLSQFVSSNRSHLEGSSTFRNSACHNIIPDSFFMTEENVIELSLIDRNQKLMSHCMLVISSWVLNNTRNTYPLLLQIWQVHQFIFTLWICCLLY